ncbi:8-amino-7-oxononanoate synthase [Saccharobesus litoralis]|uniref:8-amino-7-ketopelargonate synthase n=1 Tax=Saccharobesus litoralis TaxID=2172099 RepID=A0A2S0VTP7_9ALTE|nr:8-amino-7-oxononanoate synthase [Saccharobesus litoralis]AWB67563.1 8-amino-7-oxononanoate synthase [Saccharobesus litoralis]
MSFLTFQSQLQTSLDARHKQALYRQRYASVPRGRTVVIQGQSYLNFSGNDYLGLSLHPDIQDAYAKGADIYGCGSTGSALINGYHAIHQDLEHKLADWLGYESVLLFSTGFSANSTLLKTLFDKHDLIIQDKLNHASLIDGGLASEAKTIRYKHNDMTHLANRLEAHAQNKVIVSEGVFSMDGDSAPIKDIQLLAKKHDALTMIDDAHGIGVNGQQGQGTWHCQNAQRPDILMATFGKAFGLAGAMIASTQPVTDYLVQFSRSYIYSTAMSPAQATAISKAVDVLKSEAWRREKLASIIARFRANLAHEKVSLLDSTSAIQPVIIGDAAQAISVANRLREKGIWLTAIRPPTVPENSSRLRITLTTEHTIEDIDYLTKTISQVCNES